MQLSKPRFVQSNARPTRVKLTPVAGAAPMLGKVPVLLVVVMVFAGLFAVPPVLAQSDACSPEETAALLPPADPAYDSAIELVQTLSEHGFTIKCVLSSKMGGLFSGLEGAALYRTTDGDFDVLFLPKPRTFADLKIIERPSKKRFVYSFAGKPRPWPANRIDSGIRQYFLKHDNQLLVLNDDLLRTKLVSALTITEDGKPQ
jgi:hypothetical protein